MWCGSFFDRLKKNQNYNVYLKFQAIDFSILRLYIHRPVWFMLLQIDYRVMTARDEFGYHSRATSVMIAICSCYPHCLYSLSCVCMWARRIFGYNLLRATGGYDSSLA